MHVGVFSRGLSIFTFIWLSVLCYCFLCVESSLSIYMSLLASRWVSLSIYRGLFINLYRSLYQFICVFLHSLCTWATTPRVRRCVCKFVCMCHIEFVGLCNGEFEGLCILVLLYYSPFLQISDVLCRVRGSVL